MFSIIFVVLLLLSWTMLFLGIINKNANYNNLIEQAEESAEKRLYLQSIEYYNQAYNIKNKPKIYIDIYNMYNDYINELQYTTITEVSMEDVQTKFSEFLEMAVKLYPDEEKYWIKLIQIKLEQNSYKSALSYANKAKKNGLDSEEFNILYDKVYYMIQEEFEIFNDYFYSNEYYTVYRDTTAIILNLEREKMLEGLVYAGPVNENGYFLAQNSEEAYISDINGISRGRFGYFVEEAGYYSAESNLIPIKSEGIWFYVNIDGEKQFGGYEIASAFKNHMAAVKDENTWYFIDEKGEKISENVYEDIKIGKSGNYVVDEIIIVKENGKYKLLDGKLNIISDSESDNVDIYAGDDYIAYSIDNKWGYIDKKGRVVKEPEYIQAKSFSHGFAAVCNEEGKWGFINKDFKLIIDYIYNDADYFDKNFNCMVMINQQYKFIHFKNT